MAVLVWSPAKRRAGGDGTRSDEAGQRILARRPIKGESVSIDANTDLGKRRIFEGPEAEATLVRVALEREGIRTAVHSAHAVRARLHGAVYVTDVRDLTRAKAIVSRYLKGSVPSNSAIDAPWTCPSCGESIEGQFQACWKCGATR